MCSIAGAIGYSIARESISGTNFWWIPESNLIANNSNYTSAYVALAA